MTLLFVLPVLALLIGCVQPNWVGGQRRNAVAGAALLLIVALLANAGPREAATVGTPPPQPHAAATVPPRPITTAPEDQQRFMAVVSEFRERFRGAPNDMVRGAERPARAAALCAVVGGYVVRDWIGTVKTLSANTEGRGILAIALDRLTTLQTWNNMLSDGRDNTMLDPAGSVFQQASTLRIGQRVRFSGTLIADRIDCVREGSLTTSGAMTEPDVIFRFSDVQPAP